MLNHVLWYWTHEQREMRLIALLVLVLVLVVLLGGLQLMRRLEVDRRRRAGAEAQHAGRQRGVRRYAEEMHLSVETFRRLAVWVQQNQDSSEIWPYVSDLTSLRPGTVRWGRLSEVMKRYPDPQMALRAIYFGVQRAQDPHVRRQWEQLVQRFEP